MSATDTDRASQKKRRRQRTDIAVIAAGALAAGAAAAWVTFLIFDEHGATLMGWVGMMRRAWVAAAAITAVTVTALLCYLITRRAKKFWNLAVFSVWAVAFLAPVPTLSWLFAATEAESAITYPVIEDYRLALIDDRADFRERIEEMGVVYMISTPALQNGFDADQARATIDATQALGDAYAEKAESRRREAIQTLETMDISGVARRRALAFLRNDTSGVQDTYRYLHDLENYRLALRRRQVEFLEENRWRISGRQVIFDDLEVQRYFDELFQLSANNERRIADYHELLDPVRRRRL